MKNESFTGLRSRDVGAGLSPPGDALPTRIGRRQNGKRPRIVIARPQRGRGNLGKAVTFSPGVPCYPPRSCEIAPQGHFLALRAQGATSGFRPPRNDKLGGHCLFNIGPHFPPVRRREGTARPLQRAVDGPSKCKKPGMPENPASPIGSLTYRTVPWRGRGGRPRSGSSAAPRGLRCRWSRRRSCRRSYPHRRAPWQPRSACRASAP